MFEEAKRPVLVVAHPDDETIGLGGQLIRMKTPWIVHVTDGAPGNGEDARALGFSARQDYAHARRIELIEALALAGIGPERAVCLGFADQEAPLHLADVVLKLSEIFTELEPDAVFTHPYEGGHPDHDAVAFAVHTAARAIRRPPRLIEFTSYHSRDGSLVTGCFLPCPGAEVRSVRLSPDDRRRKRRMLACFRTQQDILRLFRDDVEKFRLAPEYDFTLPPHSGPLLYEVHDWGMTGERWRSLAAAASEELCVSPS